jgi:gliding motility-associated-like protein
MDLKRKLYFLFLLAVFCWNAEPSVAQILFYQDNCHCGVTGAGFSTMMAGGSDTLKVHIAPGSTIKKALLFGTEYWNNSIPSMDFNIILDNNNFSFNTSTRLSNINNHLESTTPNIYVHAIDITQNINSEDSIYHLEIPNINIPDCFGCIFSTVYLYILYENPNLNLSSSYVLLNDQDEHYSTEFQLTQLNKISEFTDIGWAISSARINEWSPGDGSSLSFNNGTIQAGLLKGEDNQWNDGPQGCFYFENDELFGLSNDTPDNVVLNGDAILNAAAYLNSNNNMNWNLTWEQFMVGSRFNIYNQFFIEHGTTCETSQVTTINDTTICANSPLQLYANGGIAYEWSPSENLSCSNCANPIFISDTSALLTVRIWSSDSCSVVRPVKVNVLDLPQFLDLELTGSICGANSGEVVVQGNSSSLPLTYQLDNSNFQSNTLFNNLSSGSHNLSIQDQNGCTNDTTIVIENIIQTVASFELSSQVVAVNETLTIANQSMNANNFVWSLNGVNTNTELTNLAFDTTGLYDIQLVAYQNDPSCADTFALSVQVNNELLCEIPNVFSPNNDGVNDVFTIFVNQAVESQVSILNRNGTVLHQLKGQLAAGNNLIWNGKINEHSVDEGTYFYKITLHYLGDANKNIAPVSKEYVGFFNVAF